MTDNKKNPLPKKPPFVPGSKPVVPFNRSPFTWMIIALIAISLLTMMGKSKKVEELNFRPDFIKHVTDNHVETVSIGYSEIKGTFNETGIKARKDKSPKSFRVNYNEMLKEDGLAKLCEDHGVKVTGPAQERFMPFLMSFLPFFIVLGLIYFFMMRNARGGGGMLMNFGRSKHKVQGKEQKVNFSDIAGIEEAKEEVAETIEFLKNPKRFKKIGGRIPRGVLLIGPPGCGKTLLAKAISGESDVPFFSISGSDFVEMFVGVGASRVRDLFKQAKDNSPCIIFLDEIDAIGRKRGSGFAGGGHDEREQTLNAILVEMDGFDTNDQVIVIAATNRADILDHALTRPGRFDRQVVVPLPDLKGRAQILNIHAKKVKIGPDVDYEKISRGTPMFSGAELEALINEAAISASMQKKDYVEMADMEEARDKVRWGRAKKSRHIDENEKKLTAYHEAGHAFVQYSLEDADPLHKVSIIPRGPFGGATFALPEKDRVYYSKKYCMAELQVCFGGRIAEELFCDDITSGASSDIRQATAMAKEMVLTWGMADELGPINYGGSYDQESYFPSSTPDYSQKTSELIDNEIKKLIDQTYELAKELISSNRDKLEALTDALLKYETLDAEEVKTVLEGGQLEKQTVADLLALEQKKADTDDDPREDQDLPAETNEDSSAVDDDDDSEQN